MSKFQKLYNDIINEANKQKEKWIQLSTYKGVNKFYWKKHIDQRIEERYGDINLGTVAINYLINNLILELLKRKIWKRISVKSFSCHALRSNIWFSGQIQKDKETGKKELFVATFLPSEDPDHNPYDIVINLNI